MNDTLTSGETGPAAVAGVSGLARLLAVVLFAALTALGARIAVPLPGTAVPFTLQVVAVLLAGFFLGPRLALGSQALYVATGAAGIPVFAAGGGLAYLLGPTGGYLLAFPVAAYCAGTIAWSGEGMWRLLGGGALGIALVHLGGVAWLAALFGAEEAARVGVLPFLPGDVLKLVLAVLIASRLKEPSRRFLRSR